MSFSKERARASHNLWLEKPAVLRQVPRCILLPLIGASIYVIGLLIALAGNVGIAYLESVAFLVGSGGISWVITSIREKARTVDNVYERLGEAFRASRLLYVFIVNTNFTSICNPKRHLQMALLFFIPISLAAWVAFYAHPIFIGGQAQLSLRPWMFHPDWYEAPAVHLKFVIVLLFGLGVAVVMGTAVWILLRELVLIRALARLPVMPLTEVTRNRLRPVANFNAKASFDWLIGAVLFLFMFAFTVDYLSVGVVTGISLVAIITWLYPQFVLSRIILKSHNRACDLASVYTDRLYAAANNGIFERQGSEWRIPEILSDLTAFTASPKLWVYSSSETIRWTLAETLVIIGLAVQIASSN